MGACPDCGAENPEGARFCPSCGSSLVPACPSCGAELPAAARFCPSCGAGVAAPEPAPTGRERRLVTILFADVTGSTRLGERLDPERLQEVLATYFGAMREEIEAEGGSVEKFIGDAIMAAFGVPAAHEDDPARALRAALRMRRRLVEVNRDLEERYGVTLQIRTGVNTGEVLAATNAPPGEPMVTGDAVNVAARLEQAAGPGQILVGERTARAARGFRYRELGPRELRGKERSVPAVALEREAPGAEQRGVPGLRAPMVGRERELELLKTLYERSAEEGRRYLVTIYGDPGVGKSRLVAEFVTWAGAQDPAPRVVHGRCPPYGEGITYRPLAEILKGLTGGRDSDGPGETLARIRALGDELLTTRVAEDPQRAAAALAYTVGVEDPEADLRTAEPREVRARIHAAWRSLFSALALGSPVIAVIEDIHWADPALLDLLEELAERAVGPLLFLCPSRPELTERRPGWGGGRRNVSSVALEPLSREDADRLIGFLLAVEDLPAAIHGRILERAEGNPFFLEEIVRHLIDEGRIVRDGDRWRAAVNIADVEIPDTVQGVLAARVDLLGPMEKRALQRAAVVGRVFWPEPVGRLLDGDRERLLEILDRLEERELVSSRLTSSIAGEPEFIFKHILTRDVAYETLPRGERGRAHASVAEWIETTAGGRRSEFADLLAHHYEEAYRGEREDARDPGRIEMLRARAFEALLEAADASRRRFAVARALRLAQRAVDLASTPLERARSLEQRGLIAHEDYRGDLSWESFREAVEIRLEHAPEDGPAIARACARAVENPMRWPGSMSHIPDEDDVRRYLHLGLERAPEGSTERIRLATAASFSPFAFASARGTTPEEIDQAERAGLEAADAALRLGRPDLASAALDGATSAATAIGHYGRTLPILERRLELAERLDNPWELGDAFAMAAWAWVLIGDYGRARSFEDRAFELLRVGAEGVAIHVLCWCALAEFQLGSWRRVREELVPTVLRLLGPRADDPPYFTQNLFGTAALIAEVRDDPELERHVAVLRHMVHSRQPTHRLGGVRAWLAWVLLRRGAAAEAAALLDEADRVGLKAHLPLLRQVQAEYLAEAGVWGQVPAFAGSARAYATEAGLRALPIQIDRLEGRAALASGVVERAIALLERASDGFAGLSGRWERARTDLFLAEALVAGGRREEARERLAGALAVFEDLGSGPEIERARRLAEGSLS